MHPTVHGPSRSWGNFKINVQRMRAWLDKPQHPVAASPVNANKRGYARRYVTKVMHEIEPLMLEQRTRTSNLEANNKAFPNRSCL